MDTQLKATELAEKLIEAEKQELATSELNKKINRLKIELNEAMDDEGIPSITVKVAGGELKFDPVEEEGFKLAGPVAGQEWDKCRIFHKWLEANNLGGVIKSTPTVHYQTRIKVIKEYINNGGELPDFIEPTYHSTTKFNKSLVTRLAKGEFNG